MPFAQFALPITLDAAGDWRISVAGTPTSWLVTVPDGTYYADTSGTAEDLLKVIEDTLNAGDPRGTWTVTDGTEKTIGNGLIITETATVRLTRVETIPDTIVQVDFKDLAPILGLSTDVITAADPDWISYDGVTLVIEGIHVRRYTWRPYEYTAKEVAGAPAGSSSSITRGGQAYMQGLGQYRTIDWEADYVHAAVAAQLYADDASYAARAGFEGGDPNLALEQFWRWNRVLATDGLPPVVRYCPDLTSKSNFIKVNIVRDDWVQSLQATQEEIQRGPYMFRCNVPMIITTADTAPVSGAYVEEGGGCEVVELATLAEGLSQPEGTHVRMTQTADPANNIPALVHETVMVAGGWGPAGAAIGFRDLPSGRWAWGNIDSQVGAPGSTDRLLVYRSVSGAPVTFNPNKTIDLTWTNGEGITGYFNTLKFVGIEVNIPIPRIEGSDIVIDGFPGAVGTSTLWQTFCGICNPTSIDKSIMSNLAAGAGVGGFAQSNQAVAAGALLVNATVATNPAYAGIPVRLQTQIAQSRVADDGWVVSFIPQAPEAPYDGVQAVSPPGVQTDWIANDWVTFLAITNQTSTDSWSVTSQTVLIPEPHFYNFAGGVPT